MSELKRDIDVTGPGVTEGFEVVDPAEVVGPAYPDPSFTVGEYLQGISDLLPDKALRVVLAKRRLKVETPVEELSERELDLAEAEVYYQLSNLPVGGATQKDVDGSWSHSEGGWTVSGANIEEWWRKYSRLREKWGEKVLTKSTIRVSARGMRIWPTRR